MTCWKVRILNSELKANGDKSIRTRKNNCQKRCRPNFTWRRTAEAELQALNFN